MLLTDAFVWVVIFLNWLGYLSIGRVGDRACARVRRERRAKNSSGRHHHHGPVVRCM